jgi:putative ABC transport system permease protein
MKAIHDIRLALRLLRRNPSTTVIAAVSIALSVAATAVVFAAIKSVLITPLPYAYPERLVQIRTELGNKSAPSFVDGGGWNDAREIARRTRTLESVAVYDNVIFDLAGDSSTPPEALYGLNVSANLFPTLGVKPMLGRNILSEEDEPGHANEMILSYGLWVRRFNADRGIVGRNVEVDGHDCLVIGVMPPVFNFPLRRAAAHTPSPYVEFWTPIHRHPIGPSAGIGVIARLRDGVSLQAAQADLASIDAALKHAFPATNGNRTLRLGRLRDRMLGSAAKSLWLLLSAASVFLLIGCANVANLLLAKGASRKREIAIRFAVGASNGHIVRQLLLESCILATIGGIGGYVLTAIAWKALPALAPVNIPRLGTTHADWLVFVFAVTVAVTCGVLFGMAPALRAAFGRPVSLHDSNAGVLGTRRDVLRSSLVMSEVALAITLVVIGTQLSRRFIELMGTDPGFDADHLVASVIVPSHERHITPQQRRVTYGRFLDAVRAIPGVTSVGTVNALPFSGENDGGLVATSVTQAAQVNTQTVSEIDTVSSEYLQTMEVRLLQGRWFTSDDMKESSDAAIISELTAHRLWPGQDAIGKRLCLYCTPENPNNWKQVVGVVSTMRHRSMDGPPVLNVYVAAGAMEKAIFLVVRTERPVEGLEQAIRRAVASVDPNQPVFISAPMRALISDSLADRRFMMTLLATTALLALLMAAAGVYGVVSYTTSRRTQEVGVRIALGASRNKVHLLIFRQGFAAVFFGIVIGIGLTAALLRLLHGMIPGLGSYNLTTLAVAIGLVSAAAAIACWLPARRAAKVDPMVALRYE